jgi:hypothetical protein
MATGGAPGVAEPNPLSRCGALGSVEWVRLSEPDEKHANFGRVEPVDGIEIEVLDGGCLKFAPGVTSGCNYPERDVRTGCYGKALLPCQGVDESYRLTLPGYSSEEASASVRGNLCSGSDGYWYNNGVTGQGFLQVVSAPGDCESIQYHLTGDAHCDNHDGCVYARFANPATGLRVDGIWQEYDPSIPVVALNCDGAGELLVEFDLPE